MPEAKMHKGEVVVTQRVIKDAAAYHWDLDDFECWVDLDPDAESSDG